uniref:glutathione transferase n=1 Tax=Microcebus murinus TaxID=30608 RepID=A0A8C5Y8L6_MICMU
MGLELYLDLPSQPCRAVYIFAKKNGTSNGIPFELRTVELLRQASKEFFQVNSLQRVPVPKDGDFLLTESTAILICLSCKYQTADHWYPPDLQAHTEPTVCPHQVLAPLLGTQVPEEKMDRNRTAMAWALQQLEDHFLGERAFLAGQQVTLADLMALEELILVRSQPADWQLWPGQQRLAAWRARVEAFLGAELCQEAHGQETLPVPPPEACPGMLRLIVRIP